MVGNRGGSVSVLLISEWNRGHAEAVRVSEYLFASRIKSRVWLFDFSDLADKGICWIIISRAKFYGRSCVIPTPFHCIDAKNMTSLSTVIPNYNNE